MSVVTGAFPGRASPIAPSQVTPPTLAAPGRAQLSTVLFNRSPNASFPKGAEALTLVLGRVRIEGGFPELAADGATLASSLEGRHVTVGQIFAAAAALEQAYARAGYVLVRVVVPPQRLADRGPLRLVVVDGFIESIDDQAVAPRARAGVRARLAALIGKRHLAIAEIERALLLAGDSPGLKFRSAISRGKSEGGAILIVEGDQPLVSVTTSTDNRLPATLGTWETYANFSANNLLGIGEQAYFTLGASLRADPYGVLTPPVRVLGGGLVVPLGVDGVTLTPEFTNTLTHPLPSPGAPQTIGDFNRFSLRAAFPAIRGRLQTLTLDAALEYLDQRTEAPQFGTDLNLDRYAVARVGATWQSLVMNLPVLMRAQVSRGLGGRDAADAAASGVPLSRQGTAPDFFKASMQFHLTLPLPFQACADVIARAQTTFGRPAFASEQFSLDGADAISAFATGTLNVDSGAVARTEFSRAFATPGAFALTLSPYLFAALGAGRDYAPSAAEQATLSAGAFGIGLRASPDPKFLQGATLGVEFAHETSNLTGQRSGDRVSAALGVQF